MDKPTPSECRKIVREGYDKVSCAYRSDDAPDDFGHYAQWVSILREQLPDGGAVLDIGCGCGIPASRLLVRTFDVTGVDISPVQIDRARRLVPEARFICEDISQLDFDEDTFDAVVSFYAIIHLPLDDHPELFRGVARWLRAGGYLLAIVGHKAWTGTDDRYLGVEGGCMWWSHADEATYVKWIAQAGLAVQWTRFVPEGDSGHTLVFAQKLPTGD